MKYLRRHTITALLCSSPIPFDIFEKGESKTVILDVHLHPDSPEDPQPKQLPLKERQLTLDGTYHKHSYSESDSSQIYERASNSL
jgi:hypothetical protein